MPEEKLPDSQTGLTTENVSKEEEIKINPSQDEQALKSKDEEIARLTEERNNYRTGMLKYKKQTEELDGEASDDDKVRQIVREEFINSELGKVQKEKDDLIRKILKENNEMKTTLQNKSQISGAPGGSSQESKGGEVKTEVFTPEQKADLERMMKLSGVTIPIEEFAKRMGKNQSTR